MNTIIYILLGIAFAICFISLFAYFSVTKMISKRNEKFGINSVEKGSTIYDKILFELGTIENIDKVQNGKILVLSNQLVNIENLKKLKIRAELNEKELLLYSKEFTIKLFLTRLEKELKK